MAHQYKAGDHATNVYSAGLDLRSRYGREYKRTHQGLCNSLGGFSNITPAQRILIERICERVVRSRMIFDRSIQQEGDTSEESDRRHKWYTNGIRADLKALGLVAAPQQGIPRPKVTLPPLGEGVDAPEKSLEELLK